MMRTSAAGADTGFEIEIAKSVSTCDVPRSDRGFQRVFSEAAAKPWSAGRIRYERVSEPLTSRGEPSRDRGIHLAAPIIMTGTEPQPTLTSLWELSDGTRACVIEHALTPHWEICLVSHDRVVQRHRCDTIEELMATSTALLRRGLDLLTNGFLAVGLGCRGLRSRVPGASLEVPGASLEVPGASL
jgi:hypothetical protein